ncbi:hypothetical protein [Paenibacillus ferrarius]|uniref:hypothetical protein n=1 Tax=Paenibacillus ferrarius TaxID=1469647 RepID=UPI001301A8C6|nr:hypothetical protein [Paenibacillus ferrarius]
MAVRNEKRNGPPEQAKKWLSPYQLSVASATNSTYDKLVASATIRKLDVIQKTGGRG